MMYSNRGILTPLIAFLVGVVVFGRPSLWSRLHGEETIILSEHEIRFAKAMKDYRAHKAELLSERISYYRGRKEIAYAISKEKQLKGLRNAAWEVPFLYPWRMKIGSIGRLTAGYGNSKDNERNRFIVLQVVDGENMLVRNHDGNYRNEIGADGPGKEVTTWVAGVSTAGLTDDSIVQLRQIFIVVGTKRYANALGSANTVMEIRPFTIQDETRVIEAIDAAKKEQKAKPVEREFRTWADTSGKFSIKAQYSGQISGQVILKKMDRPSKCPWTS